MLFTFTPPSLFVYRFSKAAVYCLWFVLFTAIITPLQAGLVANSDSYSTAKETLRTLAAPGILANDNSDDSSTLTATLVSGTRHGTLNLKADGSFTYLPKLGFTGTDQFTYKINDGTTDSNTATVTLTVQDINTDSLTDTEIDKIQTELEITLTDQQKTNLAAVVKPSARPQWRIDAEARIKQHRKNDFRAIIVDSNGTPITNAQVDITLRKKQFRFGGIMNLKKFAGVTPMDISTDQYKAKFLKYFDHAGLDNGLKPRLRAGNEANLPSYFSWLANNDIESRGHLLMWPGGNHLTIKVEELVSKIENESDEATKETLKTELRTTINQEITEWAGLWNVSEWDVINEVISNHRVQDILGQSELVSWFSLARNNAVRSDCKLLINDFQIISASATSPVYARRSPEYKSQIQFLIDNNAQLDKIGFQSRFKHGHIDPELLNQRIEEYATFKLPMVGTEFEVVEKESFVPTEQVRAQITEEVMTTYFSHSLMEGLFCWDFLTPGDTSTLLNNDGTPKLNGLVWYYINRIRHHTERSVNTNSAGSFQFNGYKGQYDVTVTINGQTFTTKADFTDKNLIEIPITHSTNTSNLLKINATEDAHCRQSKPDTSFPNDSRLQLRTDTSSNFNRIAYLKFNISGLQNTAIHTRLRIKSDTLAGTVEAYAVSDNSWTENTINWNNKPALGTLLGSATASTSSSFDIDLGNHVHSDGTITIALKSTTAAMQKLFSSESESPPQLLITSGTPIAPQAQDDSYTLKQNSNLQLEAPGVLANDTNLGTGQLTATLVENVKHGQLTLAADGSFTYTPNANFWGWDSFTYRASNSQGSSSTRTVSLTVLRNFVDSDNDGIDDNWEITHTGNLTTMDATTDTDNDGVSDLDEYESSTDPNDNQNKLSTTKFEPITPQTWTLQWNSRPGLRYRIQRSPSLIANSWTTIRDEVPSAGNSTSITLKQANDRMFYRILPLKTP